MKIIIPKDTYKVHKNNLLNPTQYDNFYLLFRNYVPWRTDNYEFDKTKWEEFEKFSFDEDTISNIHQRNDEVLQNFAAMSYPTLKFSMQTSWRLITGIGASSSLEVGIILHHVYGIPYIPSSSIKGILRTYLTKHSDWDKNELGDLFGSGDDEFGDAAKGKITFLDAYPEPNFQISVDIMNNHFQKYYQGDAFPGDWMDPNPIKFLTVKDASFVFRLFGRNDSITSEKLKQISDYLCEALEMFGIGAKTAVGYGRLENPQYSGTSSEKAAIDDQNAEGDFSGSSLSIYDTPDGTREFYLIRLEQIEPFSQHVQTLFQKWQLDEQWKNDPEIAKKFLPKIKKEKRSGKETHFYKVINSILGK